MDLSYTNSIPQGGFNYDNCIRNKALLEALPNKTEGLKFTKTGTTICGVVFNVRNILNFYILLIIYFEI